MRLVLVPAAAVLIAASACCGLGTRAPSVSGLTVDACGLATGTLHVGRGAGRPIALASPLHPGAEVLVGPLQGAVPLSVRLGTWPLLVSDPAWSGGPVEVRPAVAPVFAPEIGVSASARAVEHAPLTFAVSAAVGPGCDASGWPVLVRVIPPDGAAWLAAEGALDGAGRAVVTTTGTLPRGTYRVEAQLRAPEGGRVALVESTVVVGPPCVDRDGDGFLACEDDCDDANPDVHPGAREVIGDGVDNDCDGVNGRDRDGDGFEDRRSGGDDCDDANAAVYPGAPIPDRDGDGSPGWVGRGDVDCDGEEEVARGEADCDDGEAAVHPGAEEPPRANGRDDDCDGRTDEGTEAYDDDGDGQTELEGDCDDADPLRKREGKEVWDCRDNDCDDGVDEGLSPVAQDDAYEPNDGAPARLSAARRSLIGYTGTRDVVRVVSRDAADVEQFTIVAHDGLLDSFGVRVVRLEGGTGVAYDARIVTPSGTAVQQVLRHDGEQLFYGGEVDHNDSGTYTIVLQPVESRPAWCPARFQITSG